MHKVTKLNITDLSGGQPRLTCKSSLTLKCGVLIPVAVGKQMHPNT